MYDRFSWIEKDGEVLFLTPYDVFGTRRGKQLQKHTPRSEYWYGHGAIRWFYHGLKGGVERQCTNFSSPKNFPPKLVNCIKSGRMFGFGITESMLVMLRKPALAEYDKVRKTILAEYKKVKQTAWAEYEKVEQIAWAKYEKIEQTAWAEHKKVKRTAWAEYEKVEQIAWAEYEKVKQTAWAEYEKIEQTAWAEHKKVKRTALAEYEKVEQIAWAKYEKIEQTAFAKIFKCTDNRIKAWQCGQI